MLYQWLVLQDGSLPLKPDGRCTHEKHVCTSTLLWPAGTKPNRENSVLVDPCFSYSGRADAEHRLADKDSQLGCIGYYFETHPHYDHVLCLANGGAMLDASGEAGNEYNWIRLSPADPQPPPGIDMANCPGHDPSLHAIRCDTADGEVWAVGDAVLDRQWLIAWMFYWPNHYDGPEIVETWRSVAAILATASVVIPGHGAPIIIDAELLESLLERFPRAFLSRQCPDVADRLRDRLQVIHMGNSAGT